MPLVDVRSGQSLTLSDFQGKSVLVRAIAEWCSNCRAGQSAWRDQVLPQVDANSVVLVTLDVETNNSAESLAAYANNNSFPWIFAIMTPALQTELVAQFGNSVLVPPAEPQWVIRPDGSFTGLLTDRSPQTLIGLLAATGT
jgi:cytochrome oxidase Cu insertion factor (SCO1/SenC/PrrC family)